MAAGTYRVVLVGVENGSGSFGRCLDILGEEGARTVLGCRVEGKPTVQLRRKRADRQPTAQQPRIPSTTPWGVCFARSWRARRGRDKAE